MFFSNVVYEYALDFYNPQLQKNWYNEGTALYHIYMNGLYKKTKYIGFCQYDMKILHDTIPTILSDTDDKNIYCYHYFPWWFLGGQKVIVQDLHIFKCGLKSYNDFFHTNFTEDVVIKNKMCIGNTFVISSALFEKMMSWMVQYYVNDKLENNIYESISNATYNAGNIIEALVGMFFALEIEQGCTYKHFKTVHDGDGRPYKSQSY